MVTSIYFLYKNARQSTLRQLSIWIRQWNITDGETVWKKT